MSILVVETASPPTLADQLRSRGWSAIAATDGVAALAILEARHDVAMVITDARPLIVAIRSHPELHAVPIVACADAPVPDVRHVVSRPVDVAALLGIVTSLLAEEVPVLEPAIDVQSRLAIDARAYRRLAANVAALIARTTETLQPTASAPDQETLAAIAEAGLLIGRDASRRRWRGCARRMSRRRPTRSAACNASCAGCTARSACPMRRWAPPADQRPAR